MKNILFLVHRIPYPPNKGDKIRSYHLLRYLSKRFRVLVGAFVDDPDDWRFAKDVRSLCVESCLLPLDGRLGKLRSLKGIFTDQPLSLPYYFDPRMRAWVDTVTRTHKIGNALVFSSAMAQYIDCRRFQHTVIDFVDVDSDKWLQYSQRKKWPATWLYRREGRLLLEFEKDIAQRFTRSFFVSEKEAELFRRLAPEASSRVTHVNNGVDTDRFCPDDALTNPYSADEAAMVFTGAMDYWPNVDAVVWFARQVFPKIHQIFPRARFYIVGGKPVGAVRKLKAIEGVSVAGNAADVRPFIQHAWLSVAPLRIARGVQNKVLEAMAMGKAVVATQLAMEGIQASSGLDIWVSDDADETVENVLAILNSSPKPLFSKANRMFVSEHYSWDTNLNELDAVLR